MTRLSRRPTDQWDDERRGWAWLPPLPSTGFLVLYALLCTVTLVTITLYLVYPEHPLISDFAPEVSTNALAILVTLTFVQRLLNQQERRRRLRGSIGGLRRGASALSRLQEAWATILKGCFVSVPVERREVTTDLFLDVRTEELMYLDPNATLPPSDVRVLDWLLAELEPARESLRSVARQYAGGFDAEYLEALEELVDEPFLEILAELAGRKVTAREWRVRINTARGARARYFSQLVRVLELHNEIAREAARLRGARPRTRELGIVLAADYDLRVSTTIPPEWWNSPPPPGSLREPR